MAEESRILETVEQLYAGAGDNAAWAVALDSVMDLIGGAGSTFEIFDKRQGFPIVLDFGARFAGVAPVEYLQHYGPKNPRVPLHLTNPLGTLLYDRMYISETDMDRDEFHADFLAEQDLRYFVSGVVLDSADHAACVSIQRSPKQGHVEADEIALMARLMPHLQQVVDIRLRLGEALRRDAPFVQGLELLDDGVIVVDGEGYVLHTNAAAESFLSRDDGITAVETRLHFRDRSAASAFGTALIGLVDDETRDIDAPSQSFPARRAGDERAYVVTVRAVQLPEGIAIRTRDAAALVFVRDPSEASDLDAGLLRRSFSLTAAETELASLVDRGLTLEEVADRRGVAITTVRSQLYSLMEKLGINRQAQLVRLLGQYRRLM